MIGGEDGAKVIALVGAREHVLKSRSFGRLCAGLRHFRRVGSDRKSSYLRPFTKKFPRLKELLYIVRITTSLAEVNTILRSIEPSLALVIVDDKLLNQVETRKPRIRGGSPKPKYMENLVTIADNLANYFRILLKENPRKFREELKRFEK